MKFGGNSSIFVVVVRFAFQEEGQTRSSQAGVLVPLSALSERDGKQYVLLVVDSIVERRAVALAGERGKEALISSGISGGDKVIINAPANIENGTRVSEAGNG
jgi:multidrug efflux pump subunit AcrA (membrane-fusion protein)